MKDLADEICDVGKEEMKKLVPFPIRPSSLEGYLTFFLLVRKPGGAFEHQLHRFVHENNKEEEISKGDIYDALLRLEVHGYATVRKTPRNLRRGLETEGIRTCRRFYKIGLHMPPEQELLRNLKERVNIGAYLDPMSKRRLIKSLNAPGLYSQKIKNLSENLLKGEYSLSEGFAIARKIQT